MRGSASSTAFVNSGCVDSNALKLPGFTHEARRHHPFELLREQLRRILGPAALRIARGGAVHVDFAQHELFVDGFDLGHGRRRDVLALETLRPTGRAICRGPLRRDRHVTGGKPHVLQPLLRRRGDGLSLRGQKHGQPIARRIGGWIHGDSGRQRRATDDGATVQQHAKHRLQDLRARYGASGLEQRERAARADRTRTGNEGEAGHGREYRGGSANPV